MHTYLDYFLRFVGTFDAESIVAVRALVVDRSGDSYSNESVDAIGYLFVANIVLADCIVAGCYLAIGYSLSLNSLLMRRNELDCYCFGVNVIDVLTRNAYYCCLVDVDCDSCLDEHEDLLQTLNIDVSSVAFGSFGCCCR